MVNLDTLRELLDQFMKRSNPRNQEEYNDRVLAVQTTLLWATIAVAERLDALLEKR